MPLNPGLLEIIACPKCKGSVQEEGMFLTCKKCGLAFPILEGKIPNMIIQEAWPIEKAKKASFKHKQKL